MEEREKRGRMLLIVDPQIDFINGTLPVPGAKGAIDALSLYMREKGEEYDVIVITCDRHPLTHCSFSERGGEWPSHCVESSVGAAIWPALMSALPPLAGKVHFLYKGEDATRDEYSIFMSESGARSMQCLINDNGIGELDICGLAGDVCVKTTLEDALRLHPNIRYRILADFTASLDGGECIHRMASATSGLK